MFGTFIPSFVPGLVIGLLKVLAGCLFFYVIGHVLAIFGKTPIIRFLGVIVWHAALMYAAYYLWSIK